MKVLLILFKFFFILINFIILYFFSYIVFLSFQKTNTNNLFIVLMLFFTLVLAIFYYQFSNQFTILFVNESKVEIYKPLRFQRFCIKNEDIRGFSTSEIWYGKYLYSSKSFVIYTKSLEEIEIINIVNLNFDKVLSLLKKYKIKNLGKEPYQTGFFKRKYKF